VSSSVRVIRRILLVTLVLGLVGTGIELLLLEHFEQWRQMIPLGLIACALLVLAWHGVQRRPGPVRALQVLMIIFAIAGVTGLTLHYKGNVEFELEMYPTRSGLALFRKAMMGATPALAPGSMLQIALIGLAYSYRHPHLTSGDDQA
jgi:FtsH-binding integral membrane protein